MPDIVVVEKITAGTNLIGKVSIDQATAHANEVVVKSGTVTAVTAITNALPAGELHIGEVGGNSTTFDVTLSLDAGNVYADGDVLAATQALTNIARANGKGMLLHSLTVVDKDDQGIAMDLVFFGTNVALGVENAAVSIADDDADKIQGYVSVAATDFKDLGGVRVANKTSLGILLTPAAASRDLYIAAISKGAGTYSASGVTVHLGVLRD